MKPNSQLVAMFIRAHQGSQDASWKARTAELARNLDYPSRIVTASLIAALKQLSDAHFTTARAERRRALGIILSIR